MYGLPPDLTPDDRLALELNTERARQLQVHTAVEAACIAGGQVGADAYYARWPNAEELKSNAILDQFIRNGRGS